MTDYKAQNPKHSPLLYHGEDFPLLSLRGLFHLSLRGWRSQPKQSRQNPYVIARSEIPHLCSEQASQSQPPLSLRIPIYRDEAIPVGGRRLPRTLRVLAMTR